MSSNVYLVLENGKVFKGKAFGAKKETIGELVFNTSMTGYLETITDPSCYGQVMLQTFPLIGNYGIIPEDFESDKVQLNAYVVRDWCQEPSNFRCKGDLDTFLMSENIPGVANIDTRSLTKIIRDNGTMKCKVTYTKDNIEEDLKEIKEYKLETPVKEVSVKEVKTFKSDNSKYNIVALDFGIKKSIINQLLKRNCTVTLVPYNTSKEDVLNLNPDGILLSNGPGDPKENKEVIKEIAEIIKHNIPIFGIGLGHQLLALANGGKVKKMVHGHMGANQPVKDLNTDRMYITSQGHSFNVVKDTIQKNGKVTFINGNDNTCEGITYSNIPGFSVQFSPEGGAGPQDTLFLFDDFINLINKE